MSNPLFQMIGPQNPMAQMMQRFQQFQQSFRGDPRQQVQQLLNSGKVSQQMYDSAVQKAQQIQQMLTPNARR
jgi:hypothetical protein